MTMTADQDDERTVLIGADAASYSDNAEATELLAGGRIGVYRLLEPIGEGGMGQVWLAEQREPIQRKVALKLIRRQLAGSLAHAYFEIERQALARMDHPAIAKVLDAGRTPEGYPWFAMEYVDGQPLDEWCRQHIPSQRQRIELLIALAYGVQHAHQRGIIHRDLKPSNVLVSQVDGRAQPRLIDFGIATAVDSGAGASARSSYERVGSGLYMSPEQYAADASIDTRADVYSLGMVLLVALLSAQDQSILNGLNPHTTTPHQRISDSLRTPGREPILDRLPRELRHIIARAAHPLRDQRYASATALAEDLQRYLDGHAVTAVPDSRRYRLRKFVQRRRRLLSMAAVAALALIVGLAAAVWGFVEAERQAKRSQATSDFLATVLSGIDPDVAAELDKTLMRKVLDEAATRASSELADQPDALADIEGVISDSYNALGEIAQTLVHAKRSYDLHRAQFGPDDERTLRRARALGRAEIDAGNVNEAISFLRDAAERSRHVWGKHALITLLIDQSLSWALRENGQPVQALAIIADVADILEAELGGDSAHSIETRHTQAIVLADLDRHDEAIPLMKEQIERRSRMLGAEHARVLNMRNSLAVFYLQKRRFAEAEQELAALLPLMERVYGPESSYALMTMSNLGGALRQQGKVQESGPFYERSFQTAQTKFGPRHPRSIASQHNYANYLLDAGRALESYDLQKDAYDATVEVMGDSHSIAGSTLRGQGRAALRLGRLDEAESLLLRALEIQNRIHASGNTQVVQTRESLVELYEAMNKPEQALRYRDDGNDDAS